MTDYDWDAIDHYSRGWAAGYRAACERAEGPTEPMEAYQPAAATHDASASSSAPSSDPSDHTQAPRTSTRP